MNVLMRRHLFSGRLLWSASNDPLASSNICMRRSFTFIFAKSSSFCRSRYPWNRSSLKASILIIVLRRCSSDIVECSADKLMRSATASQAQKRAQTGASPNAYFTCFIFQSIHLGFSIFQHMIYTKDSEEQSKNRKNKESAASELSFGHFKFIFYMFSCSHN
jgi:hypothetical protein